MELQLVKLIFLASYDWNGSSIRFLPASIHSYLSRSVMSIIKAESREKLHRQEPQEAHK